ncbi:hypothetical protein AAG906_011030 [Vitis piasezkii]
MEWVALVDNLEAFNKYPWGIFMRGHYLVCKELWSIEYPNTKIRRKQRKKLQLKHIVLLDFHMPSKSTEIENVFLEPNLNFHSLLTPTLEEQQQDYYKHVDKQGDAKKDDLRHEKRSSNTTTAAMAEETTNDAIAPSIEVT